MQKIIYSSPSKIEWDAQSAFKITNYYTDTENHMIFCYLKQYVQNGNLHLCTYCFDKEATGKNDLQLCFNLNPEQGEKYIHMEFGVEGIDTVFSVEGGSSAKVAQDKGISYRSFTSNDQQGYYWCGEITFDKDFIKEHFDTLLDEKSIILMNFYKIFPDCGDYACLFPDNKNDILAKADSMQEFVVLKY